MLQIWLRLVTAKDFKVYFKRYFGERKVRLRQNFLKAKF
ncbi:hypothetical protein CAMSH0001_0469 [Campylobacter showae RM3277]|uniref:Uncharacterized protein n=1 Tax=Campylobacter showae RM3277 TaxID=553219 RepID=C6RFG4_9BACT|nr:hypothetical protein CAMSH0001_0469 [Campylobacter showae RM3277]